MRTTVFTCQVQRFNIKFDPLTKAVIRRKIQLIKSASPNIFLSFGDQPCVWHLGSHGPLTPVRLRYFDDGGISDMDTSKTHVNIDGVCRL